MAIVYRNPGNLEFLMKGFYGINGKCLDRLEDIESFFDNYQELYLEIEERAKQQVDEEIARLDRELIKLYDEYSEKVADRSWSVDGEIRHLHFLARTSPGLWNRTRLGARASVESLLRNRKVHRPLSVFRQEIRLKKQRKKDLITRKSALVDETCQRLSDTYSFIYSHLTLLEAARREEKVVEVLSKLSNEYHVINDVSLRWHRPGPGASGFTALSDRVDHVVIGPTGLFLILVPDHEDTATVVGRAARNNRDMGRFLRRHGLMEYEARPQSVIVSFTDNARWDHAGESIDIVPPNRLNMYVKRQKNSLTPRTIELVVRLLSR
jgi:hypothetical protein